MAKLARCIVAHAPYDGTFELRMPGLHASRFMATVFHDLARELRTGTRFMGGLLFQFGSAQAQDRTTALGKETDPSPVTLRLMKAPERDTLSPKERAVYLVLSKM
jgi:hypothetical protein